MNSSGGSIPQCPLPHTCLNPCKVIDFFFFHSSSCLGIHTGFDGFTRSKNRGCLSHALYGWDHCHAYVRIEDCPRKIWWWITHTAILRWPLIKPHAVNLTHVLRSQEMDRPRHAASTAAGPGRTLLVNAHHRSNMRRDEMFLSFGNRRKTRGPVVFILFSSRLMCGQHGAYRFVYGSIAWGRIITSPKVQGKTGPGQLPARGETCLGRSLS